VNYRAIKRPSYDMPEVICAIPQALLVGSLASYLLDVAAQLG
jgi:hypothetical protein